MLAGYRFGRREMNWNDPYLAGKILETIGLMIDTERRMNRDKYATKGCEVVGWRAAVEQLMK
jgi:hypothetical protein